MNCCPGSARAALTFALVLIPADPVAGQGITAAAGGLFGEPTRSQYALGWLIPKLGALEVSLGGTFLKGDDGRRMGAQLELDLFRAAPGRLYGVASLAGGWGDRGAESPWGSWSAGLGWRLLSLGRTDLGLEARYLRLATPDDVLSLGVRLASRFGGGAKQPAPPPAPAPPTRAVPSADSTPSLATVRPASEAAQLVTQTAIDAMGTPYVWGGTGANGFDCSGLIQYAYARHGITLPRRSADQARVGLLVPRQLDQLVAGDILTFSASPGGPVTHVGLYVGDRRFIHSSSSGVRLSLLSPDDPQGKHWWDRWAGARRVLQD